MDPHSRTGARSTGPLALAGGRLGRLRRSRLFQRLGRSLAILGLIVCGAPAALGQADGSTQLFERFLAQDAEGRAALADEVLERLPLLERRIAADCKRVLFKQLDDLHYALRAPGLGLSSEALIEGLTRADRVARDCDDDHYSGSFSYSLAELLERSGEPLEALEVLERRLEDLPAENAYGPYLANLGSRLRASLGRLRGALEYADRGLDQLSLVEDGRKDVSYHTIRASLLGGKLEVYLELGLGNAAWDHIDWERESAEEAERAGNPRPMFWSLLHQLDYYLGFQMHRKLEHDARKSLRDMKGAGDRAEVELRLAIGLADLENTDAERAREARELFERLSETEQLVDVQRLRCLTWLLELDLRERELAKARERAAALEAALDDLGSGEGDRPLADLRTLYEGLRGRLNLALAETLDAEEGAQLREQSLVRLREEMSNVLEQWTRTPQRRAGIAFLRQRSRRLLLSQLIQHELRSEPATEGPRRALEHLHRVHSMGSYAREQDYQLVPLPDLQRALCDERTGLLVYLPSDGQGHLFCVGREDVTHVDLPREADWRPRRAELERVLLSGRKGDPAQLGELTRQLGQDLLPPAARAVIADSGWKAVSIVGQDVLGYVPFEYLPGSQSRWLYQELDVCYLGSLPLGVLLAGQERATPTDEARDLHLVIANELEGRSFPFGRAERELLTSAYREGRVQIDAGPRATLAALRAAFGRGDAVAHIVAHGDLREGELRPEIALAGDQPLGPGTLDDWSGAPRLVILSVCRAALGDSRPGDDVPIDLGGAYLAAGSQAVIHSRMKVEYEAQAAMAPVLGAALRRGESPARALSLAREALARQEEFAHPFHGMVHVVGLGHRPVFEGD